MDHAAKAAQLFLEGYNCAQAVVVAFEDLTGLDRTFSAYTVRVGFVKNADVQLDEYGNEVPPTEEDATFFQTYTLTRDKENKTFYVRSCVNE